MWSNDEEDRLGYLKKPTLMLMSLRRSGGLGASKTICVGSFKLVFSLFWDLGLEVLIIRATLINRMRGLLGPWVQSQNWGSLASLSRLKQTVGYPGGSLAPKGFGNKAS